MIVFIFAVCMCQSNLGAQVLLLGDEIDTSVLENLKPYERNYLISKKK